MKEMKISLSAALTCALLLIGSLPILIQNQVLLSSYRVNLIETRMQEIQNQCQIISNKMTRTGYFTTDTKDPLMDQEMSIKADMFNGRIVLVNRNFRIISDTFSLAVGKINVSEEAIRCFNGENSSKYHSENGYCVLTVPVYSGNQDKEITGIMIVTASTEDLLNRMSSLSEKGTFLQFMVFLLLLIAAFFLGKLLMRPFEELNRLLNRAVEGDLNENISSGAYKETGEIADSINRTLKKLKAVDLSREEFVSNVSHELKTPITSIRVLADSLMSLPQVPEELYREFMTDISDEIDRENKIIEDLLALVRLDKTAGGNLNIAQVNINELLELILKRLKPIAGKGNVELILESIREVTAEVDEMKLSLALSNLVENAVKYNVEGGWIRVTLDADHKFFYVKVADSGIGIPEEFQEHVFERFYRVDKARSRQTGGTGLGLAITRKIVLMHQGAIKLHSKEGEGSTFTVRIPLTYIS